MERKNRLQKSPRLGSNVLVASLSLLLLQTGSAQVSSTPKQILLSAELSHPTLLNETKQTAYMKINLEGFELDSTKKRAPINVALVIDKSGSMGERSGVQNETRLENAKRAASLAVEQFLQPQDIISVIAYDDQAEVLVPATKATEKASILRAIRQIQIGGGTGLFSGVTKGAKELGKFLSKNQVNRVILLSDGEANVGPSSPSELGDLGAALAKKGISVTTIGIGLGYNEDLMTQLALRSDGNHAFARDAEQLATIFKGEFGDVLSVVAQDVKITILCKEGIKPIRALGREANIYGQKVTASLQQLYSKQDKYILLEVEVDPALVKANQPIASVETEYHHILSQNRAHVNAQVLAMGFSSDRKIVEKTLNKKVMAAVVEQQGAARAEQALKLMDKGDRTGALMILEQNAVDLEQGAARYDAPALKVSADSNREAAKSVPSDANLARKGLRVYQHKINVQQKN